MRDHEFWKTKLAEAKKALRAHRESLTPLIWKRPSPRFGGKRFGSRLAYWGQAIAARRKWVHDLAKIERQIVYFTERVEATNTRGFRVLNKPPI